MNAVTLYVCPKCERHHLARYDATKRDQNCPHRGDYFEAIHMVKLSEVVALLRHAINDVPLAYANIAADYLLREFEADR